MHPSEEYLKLREEFIAPAYMKKLSADVSEMPGSRTDHFTATADLPKAFRVGSCIAESDDKATLEVVLLWRDDTRNDQKEIRVETIKQGDKWLIASVN